MAYVSSIPARLTLSQRINSYLSILRQERARRASYLRTLRELGAMSDRDLTDIGINRLQIEEIARAHAYAR